MKTQIEYRVRTVTRYIVSRYSQVGEAVEHTNIGEYSNIHQAEWVGEALHKADVARLAGHPDATIGYESIAPVPPKMRCKMRLTGVVPHTISGELTGGVSLQMNAVWGGADPEDGGNADHENRIFAKATPQASFTAWVENPETAKMLQGFDLGQDFYLDIIPAPKE